MPKNLFCKVVFVEMILAAMVNVNVEGVCSAAPGSIQVSSLKRYRISEPPHEKRRASSND